MTTLRSTSLALLVCAALPSAAFGQEGAAPATQPTAPPETAAAPAPAAPEAAPAAEPAAAPVENSADLFNAPDTAPAAAPAAEAAAPATDSGFLLKFRGAHEFDFHQPVYGDKADYKGEMKAPAFRNELGVEARYGTLKLVSEWSVDLLLNRNGTGQSANSGYDNGQLGAWDSLARLRPLENYLSWSPEGTGLKVAAGYQIFAWGVADKINPTDNLNPHDYTQGIIENVKIPVLAADVTWYPVKSLSIEGVYVPVDQPNRWPVDWASTVQAAAGTTTPVGYRDLELGPNSFVAGGRIAYRGLLDASLSYLYDWDQYYTASVAGYLISPLHNAGITLERSRVHRVGADLKGTLGSFGLWAEAAANFTDHSDPTTVQRHWWLDYVVGTDSNFGPADKGYFNLQYIGTVIPDYDDSPLDLAQAATNPAYAEGYFRTTLAGALGFQTAKAWQGGSLDVKYELFDGKLTPELRTVYLIPVGYDDSALTHYGSLVLNPEIDFSPMDSFHILLGADLAWSWVKKAGSDDIKVDESGDRIGEFTRFNNVYLKLAYKWNLEAKR